MGQGVDRFDHLSDQQVAGVGGLVGALRRFGCLRGMTGDFLHRGRHLGHGCRHFRGVQFLLLEVVLGRCGGAGQLRRGNAQLAARVHHVADDFAQFAHHLTE
ncbi:hypothetical protein D3C86_1857830 [compost metagenome]